jgi:hypothetical protein
MRQGGWYEEEDKEEEERNSTVKQDTRKFSPFNWMDGWIGGVQGWMPG